MLDAAFKLTTFMSKLSEVYNIFLALGTSMRLSAVIMHTRTSLSDFISHCNNNCVLITLTARELNDVPEAPTQESLTEEVTPRSHLVEDSDKCLLILRCLRQCLVGLWDALSDIGPILISARRYDALLELHDELKVRHLVFVVTYSSDCSLL